MPSSLQAADYSAASNYLKAVQTAGTTDADKVMSTLKTMKFDDFYSKGQIRADGRMIHDMYLYQVKGTKESSTPWDYYKMVAKVPGDQAFTTVAESKCAGQEVLTAGRSRDRPLFLYSQGKNLETAVDRSLTAGKTA